MNRNDLQILLIQVRHDEVLRTEYDSFVKGMNIEPSQLTSINVFERLPTLHDLEGIHAVILGGSGAYCVSERAIPNEIEAMNSLVRIIYERNMPLLGVCFGSHIMTDALGGVVEHHPDKKEVGSYAIQLCDAVVSDPLFDSISRSIIVQQGHKDGSVVLPPHAIPLATSELWEHQAYTISDKPLYAVQFHPELTEDSLRARLSVYMEEYFGEQRDEMQQLHASIRPSPESAQLLTRFIDRIVLPHWNSDQKK